MFWFSGKSCHSLAFRIFCGKEDYFFRTCNSFFLISLKEKRRAKPRYGQLEAQNVQKWPVIIFVQDVSSSFSQNCQFYSWSGSCDISRASFRKKRRKKPRLWSGILSRQAQSSVAIAIGKGSGSDDLSIDKRQSLRGVVSYKNRLVVSWLFCSNSCLAGYKTWPQKEKAGQIPLRGHNKAVTAHHLRSWSWQHRSEGCLRFARIFSGSDRLLQGLRNREKIREIRLCQDLQEGRRSRVGVSEGNPFTYQYGIPRNTTWVSQRDTYHH